MKLYISALVIAVALASAMAIVIHLYSPHSTPGIWMMVVGIPGTLVGVWAGSLAGKNEFVFYVVTVSVNFAFYLTVTRALQWVKRKFSQSTTARHSH